MKLDEASDGKDKPSIDVLPQAPVPHCPLKARVWMLYEQRHIEAGRQFYDESRQRVRFVRDADKKADVEIASADEVSPAVWTLKICHGQCDRGGKDQNLKGFVAPHRQKRDLVFTGYGQAVKLAHWLRYQRRGVTLNKLQFDYPVDGNKTASSCPTRIRKTPAWTTISLLDESDDIEITSVFAGCDGTEGVSLAGLLFYRPGRKSTCQGAECWPVGGLTAADCAAE